MPCFQAPVFLAHIVSLNSLDTHVTIIPSRDLLLVTAYTVIGMTSTIGVCTAQVEKIGSVLAWTLILSVTKYLNNDLFFFQRIFFYMHRRHDDNCYKI